MGILDIHSHRSCERNVVHLIRVGCGLSGAIAAAEVAQQTRVHVHVLGLCARDLVAVLLSLDVAVAERDGRVLHGDVLPRHIDRIVAVAGRVQRDGRGVRGTPDYIRGSRVANMEVRLDVARRIVINTPKQQLRRRIDIVVSRTGGSDRAVKIVVIARVSVGRMGRTQRRAIHVRVAT